MPRFCRGRGQFFFSVLKPALWALCIYETNIEHFRHFGPGISPLVPSESDLISTVSWLVYFQISCIYETKLENIATISYYILLDLLQIYILVFPMSFFFYFFYYSGSSRIFAHPQRHHANAVNYKRMFFMRDLQKMLLGYCKNYYRYFSWNCLGISSKILQIFLLWPLQKIFKGFVLGPSRILFREILIHLEIRLYFFH